MNLTEIQAAWESDCKIDENNPGHSAATTPMLHSKYLNESISAKLLLVKIQNEIVKSRVTRGRYFRGEMTTQELNDKAWAQWQYKTLKSDISDMIEACDEVQTLITRESYLKQVIWSLDSILGEIKARSFHTRVLMDWVKHRDGN
jgi:hypothetical protein